MKTTIGFIGLGNLGTPIAKNLIAAGYHLQVYNRTLSKIDELDQTSITKCGSPAEAAKSVNFIITVLANDAVLRQTVVGDEGILKTLPLNAIHISMSTIAPDTAEELADLHKQAGNSYLASPVFGRPDAAAAKMLWTCISGEAEVKEAAKPILECTSREVIDFGEKVGSANVVKISGNFMIQASMEMMAEAYTMAEKFGVDRGIVAEFFGNTLFNAPIFKSYGKAIAEKKYEPVGFTTELGYKDASLVLKLSQQSKTPMPFANIIHNRLLVTIAKGRTGADWAEAFGKGVTDDAGV
ncbi:NAD(P)-dependent oxidoreductase [Mucilaginibacter agri]|uniref:NAD-binding protein n=1 Tax=Mucilaginibacter agri TaxID=2695265 RepID=A0A965ZEX9_9SPHI|nr:NAD(P)-dependent oxidoreductase [Mucilaginibacter agri]NCD69813.1 NAD-binding protein [Mucilaginibacter agri]